MAKLSSLKVKSIHTKKHTVGYMKLPVGDKKDYDKKEMNRFKELNHFVVK
jgi:hypothetical protein